MPQVTQLLIDRSGRCASFFNVVPLLELELRNPDTAFPRGNICEITFFPLTFFLRPKAQHSCSAITTLLVAEWDPGCKREVARRLSTLLNPLPSIPPGP